MRRLRRSEACSPDLKMTDVALNLVVICASELERSRQFYAALGLRFTKEQHCSGPEHYACDLGSMVFELYPKQQETASQPCNRVGFKVASLDATLASLAELNTEVLVHPKM